MYTHTHTHDIYTHMHAHDTHTHTNISSSPSVVQGPVIPELLGDSTPIIFLRCSSSFALTYGTKGLTES